MTGEPEKIHSLLVLGGARSGKSRYAQLAAEGSGLSPCLIATAEAGDPEMLARIARHRAERGPHWRTVEEPLGLPEALARETRPGQICVVDCVSFWLANLMFSERDVDADIRRLETIVPTLAAPVIFVANEVGLSVVPDHELGRSFRDAQGLLNQALGRCCDHVVLIAAGLPVLLKPATTPVLRF